MQFDFAQEKQRRIAQFAQALKPMHRRTVKQVKDCCFLIIDERNTTADFFQSLTAIKYEPVEVPSVLRLERERSEKYTIDSGLYKDLRATEGWSTEGWRADEDSDRFIQFVFPREALRDGPAATDAVYRRGRADSTRPKRVLLHER